MQRLQEARDFLEELAGNPPLLPYEPMLLPQLFAATKEESNASIDDLTKLIERSQKLASRVLSIANSAVYALESTITSLHRAISVLGFREVRSLVITITAVSAIKSAKLPREFDATRLWRHQVRSACIAKSLAWELRSQDWDVGQGQKEKLRMAPDEAYAAALLHDIGKVFLAAARPAIWGAIENLRRQNKISFHEAEDEYWGMDHALIGAQVLHYWKLPLLLTDPINWHHAPHVAPAFKVEARLISAANIIANKGFNTEGTLPQDAMMLLPQNADPNEIEDSVRQALLPDRTVGLSRLIA